MKKIRYKYPIAAMVMSAALLMASQFCVYASNDYLSEKETKVTMAPGITMTTTVDYVGNYVYENGTLTRILFDGGYVDMTGTAPKYMFYLTDHLGNVRVVADSEGNVEQVNHYYPYGDRFEDSRYTLASSSSLLLSSSSSTDRLFGGKELDSSSCLYDFEARYDNTMFGRFTTIDPMAEKYYGISPYSYCACDPVNLVDPDGKDWYYTVHPQGKNYLYNEDVFSQEDLDKLKIDGFYLGPTFEDGNNYYSYFGNIVSLSDSSGKPTFEGMIYKRLDSMFANYIKREGHPSADFSQLSEIMKFGDVRTVQYAGVSGEEHFSTSNGSNYTHTKLSGDIHLSDVSRTNRHYGYGGKNNAYYGDTSNWEGYRYRFENMVNSMGTSFYSLSLIFDEYNYGLFNAAFNKKMRKQ